MESICRLRVRTYECDSYGHVNNAVYLHYLETARYQFLKDAGFDYNALLRAGYGIYIARVEIEYVKSARFDDLLAIHSVPVNKGALSGVIAQDIYREQPEHDGTGDIPAAGTGDLVARAKVKWAVVDSVGRPHKIPAEFDVPGLQPSQ
jgi:acyl-CoA thioester hydrolase